MNEFTNAVERFIASTESNDFISSLHTIYRQIQSLSPDDVIATMNTLIAMDKANSHVNTRTQIKGMKTACSVRAAQLMLTNKENRWLGDVLLGLLRTDYNIEDGREIVEKADKKLG